MDGVLDGILRARVAAPAVDGAANESLTRLIARELGVPRTSVRIVAGTTGRQKLLAVTGATPEALLARWPGLTL